MEKEKQKQETAFERVCECLKTVVFLVFLYGNGVILQLYFKDGYFDILEAKAGFFFILMKLLLPFLLFLLSYKIIKKQFCLSPIKLLLILFLLGGGISTVFSVAPEYAFTGEQGWHVGFFTMFSLIVFFLVYEGDKIVRKPFLYLPLLLLFCFETILVFLEVMDIDVLSMKAQLDLPTSYSFFGTIGNSNWTVGFFSLFVPCIVSQYLFSESKALSSVCFVLGLSGIIASILMGADGIFLSIIASVIAIAPCITEKWAYIRRFLFLLCCFLLIALFFSLSPKFTLFFDIFDGAGDLFFEHPYFLKLLFIGLSILYLVSYALSEKEYQKKRKAFAKIGVLLFAVATVVFLGFVFNYKGDQIDNYRFELWKLSLHRFSSFDLYHKLFGLGPELVRNLYGSLYEKYGIVFTVAHNEALQLLLTMGIIGLSFWTGLWVLLLVSYVKARIYKNPVFVGAYASLFAYLAQAMVNSATIPNLCLLILLLVHISDFAFSTVKSYDLDRK